MMDVVKIVMEIEIEIACGKVVMVMCGGKGKKPCEMAKILRLS